MTLAKDRQLRVTPLWSGRASFNHWRRIPWNVWSAKTTVVLNPLNASIPAELMKLRILRWVLHLAETLQIHANSSVLWFHWNAEDLQLRLAEKGSSCSLVTICRATSRRCDCRGRIRACHSKLVKTIGLLMQEDRYTVPLRYCRLHHLASIYYYTFTYKS